MASYLLRTLARNDLEIIWEYTLDQWGMQQAERYFSALFTCFDDLAGNPQIGRQPDDVMAGSRSFPQGRHVVFYEIDHAGIKLSALFTIALMWTCTLTVESKSDSKLSLANS